MENSQDQGLARIIAYAPLIFWIGVIFYLSSNLGAFSETSRFIGPLLEFLFPDASNETLAAYHGFIRKCAHLAVYAVLGFLAMRASRHRSTSPAFTSLTALILVVIIASLDELNQSFSAERTGTAWDILLDTAGGLAAIGITLLCFRKERRGEASSESVSY